MNITHRPQTLSASGRRPRINEGDDAALISLHGVCKTYTTGEISFTALDRVDLTVRRGEFVGVVGPSGSGKSTLLNLMAAIDRPSAGHVVVGGVEVSDLSENDAARWRGRNLGVIFQFFQLLPTLSLADNVMLPMDLCGVHPRRQRPTVAREPLARVGLADHADKLPSQISGGQEQRAAIARALAKDPPIIVGDEPTGNLDSGRPGRDAASRSSAPAWRACHESRVSLSSLVHHSMSTAAPGLGL